MTAAVAPGNRLVNILLLSALSALPPLSIDMGLPALTQTSLRLQTSPAMAGMTLSLFMLGFAASPLVYGMLSDRYGRKPLLLIGLGLFAIGGVLCTVAPSIGWLLAARMVQGAGAGVGPTIAMAASRDLLEGVVLRRRLANLAMLRNVAPIVAPSIGALLLALGGWRAISAMLALAGIVLFAIMRFRFVESLSPGKRRDGALLPELWRSARYLMAAHRALAFAAVSGGECDDPVAWRRPHRRSAPADGDSGRPARRACRRDGVFCRGDVRLRPRRADGVPRGAGAGGRDRRDGGGADEYVPDDLYERVESSGRVPVSRSRGYRGTRGHGAVRDARLCCSQPCALSRSRRAAIPAPIPIAPR